MDLPFRDQVEAPGPVRKGILKDKAICYHLGWKRWKRDGGKCLQSTCGRKPVVGPPDRPFAELRIAHELEEMGWTAAWVFKTGLFLRTWEPRGIAYMPKPAVELYNMILKAVWAKGRRGENTAGSWDVFAWKDGRCLFAEVKRMGKDRPRESQRQWRDIALKERGVSKDSFIVVEWAFQD